MTKSDWFRAAILVVVAAALLAPWVLSDEAEKEYDLIHHQSSGGTVVLYLLDKQTGEVYQNRDYDPTGWHKIVEAMEGNE